MLHWLIHAYLVLTGAANEAGRSYGFWSGFGGTVLFSALIISPGWYWQRSCHDSWKCLRWGKYPAAGGLFKLCHHHHPDLQGQRPHRELIHRLHAEHKQART